MGRLCKFFFFKQKTAYEMRISDWSSDVCSSDLQVAVDAIVGDRIEVVVEVLDVARVADPVDVGACLPGPVDVLPAEEAEAPAVVLAAVLQRIAFLDELGQLLVAVTAGQVVRRQVAEIKLAAAGWSQVAELGVPHQAALGHEPGFQGFVED